MRTKMVSPESVDWRDFLTGTPHDFYHLPEYVALDARHQGGQARAFLAEAEGDGLLIPLVVRPVGPSPWNAGTCCDVIGPYGYGSPLFRSGSSGDPARFARAAMEAFLEELRALHVVSAFFRLHPTLPPPPEALLQSGHLVHHGETVVLDLTLTAEEMWQQTRENHRRGIKRAEKAGYSVEIDSDFRHIETFQQIYDETMRRVGAGSSYSFSLDYFQALKERLGGNLHLCVVRNGSEIACAGLFTETCRLVQYHLGGTGSAHLNYQPSKLMFHFIRGWAKQRGNSALVLGAGVGGHNDELFHFKSGFSRLSAPFRTWRVVVDERGYRQLVRAWEDRQKTSADGLDGFFPAYRKGAGGLAGIERAAAPLVRT